MTKLHSKYAVDCSRCGEEITFSSSEEANQTMWAQKALIASGVIKVGSDEVGFEPVCTSCAEQHAGPDWEARGRAHEACVVILKKPVSLRKVGG